MRLLNGFLSLLLASCAAASPGSPLYPRQNATAGYELKTGPLDTPWTTKVGTNPWPEYPRPLLQRPDWKNLNGVWQYKHAAPEEINAPPFGVDLDRSVLVPFCLESALSGMLIYTT
jgi:hypothetical protein